MIIAARQGLNPRRGKNGTFSADPAVEHVCALEPVAILPLWLIFGRYVGHVSRPVAENENAGIGNSWPITRYPCIYTRYHYTIGGNAELKTTKTSVITESPCDIFRLILV